VAAKGSGAAVVLSGKGTLPQQVWEALQVATNLVAAFDAASVIHHL